MNRDQWMAELADYVIGHAPVDPSELPEDHVQEAYEAGLTPAEAGEHLLDAEWQRRRTADNPYDTPEAFIDMHRQLGHEPTYTSISAPGTGTGSYCFTCKESGPTRGFRILSVEDVI